MIFSVDAGKTFDRNHCSFMIKTLNKLRIEENFLNLIKAIYFKNLLPSSYLMVIDCTLAV